MDYLSIAGVVLAVTAVIGGHLIEGGSLVSLFNPAAFVIVVFGTIAASLLGTSLAVFRGALRRLRWVFVPPPATHEELIEKIVGWSQIARRAGLLGLEDIIERETEPFTRKALQMLVDGADAETIRHAMEKIGRAHV